MFNLSTLAVILSALLSPAAAREPLCASAGAVCDFDSDCCTNHRCDAGPPVNGLVAKTCKTTDPKVADSQKSYGAPISPEDPQDYVREALRTNKGANPSSKWSGRNVQFPSSKSAKTPVLKTATTKTASTATKKTTRK